MHIPDGYLGPETYITMYGISAFFWIRAVKKVREKVDIKQVPYIAMSSAFSFLIMMFNIPIPGGTTGHAVGAGVIALVLGPWVSVISVSVALIIQSVVFGDGGITAIGANCFNIAVVMSFVCWYVFKIIKRSSKRYYVASFIAGYISINIAAIVTAVELGIQPIIASQNGRALYCPYPLSLSVAAMSVEHLLLFGFVEAFVTAGVLSYFLKNQPDMVEAVK